MTEQQIEQMFSQMIQVVETLQSRVSQLEKENEALIKSNTSLIDWMQ